jgi:hypothetical protein
MWSDKAVGTTTVFLKCLSTAFESFAIRKIAVKKFRNGNSFWR